MHVSLLYVLLMLTEMLLVRSLATGTLTQGHLAPSAARLAFGGRIGSVGSSLGLTFGMQSGRL